MRVVYFGNNWLGWQVLAWLRSQREEIVALVLHASERRKYGPEMLKASGLRSGDVIEAPQLVNPKVIEGLRALAPAIGVSVMFGHILHRNLLEIFPRGCVNLHTALLPYNRGAYPNVWSIVDDTPAGVTLHVVNEKVDGGEIIAQHPVEKEPVDTGATLYRKLESEALALFKEAWPLVRSGKEKRTSQPEGVGTTHRTKDVERIDPIDLDRSYKARELIDVLRARTFPPYPGAYFLHQGRKVYLRLQLLWEEQLAEETEDGRLHRN